MATVCVNSNEFEVDDQGRLNIKKGCGLVSDTTGLHPATSPWPFTCDEEDNGTLITCSPVDGLLRGAPRGRVFDKFTSTEDGANTNIASSPQIVLTNDMSMLNNSCYPAFPLQVIQAQVTLLVAGGTQVHAQVGGLDPNPLIGNEVGDWEPQGGSAQHRIGGEFTVIRNLPTVAAGASITAKSNIILDKVGSGNADRVFVQLNHRLILFSV